MSGPPVPSVETPRRLILASVLIVILIVAAAGYLWILPALNPPPNPPSPTTVWNPPPSIAPIALGSPTEASKGSNTWYNFSVQSAGGGLTLNDLALQVQDPGGSIVPPTAAWTLKVLDLTGGSVGSYSMTYSQWSSGGSVAVTSQLVFTLNSGSSSLSGDDLIISGTGSFQGTISVSIP